MSGPARPGEQRVLAEPTEVQPLLPGDREHQDEVPVRRVGRTEDDARTVAWPTLGDQTPATDLPERTGHRPPDAHDSLLGAQRAWMRLIASARVAASRIWPRTAEVTVARAGLAHAAHRHAQVLALDHDDHTARPTASRRARRRSATVSRSWTCGRRANTSTSRASFDSPVMRPSVARDVADVRDAVERHEVVLARGVHLDVLDQDHLLVAEVEGRGQDVLGDIRRAREDLAVRARDPSGGVAQALTVRVLADGEQELADRRLGTWLVVLPA